MDEQPSRIGRPRSEQARTAVLHAVDDLLVEVGYAAITMKGIAERAGVGRQTVYRWWSTKAEILFEASVVDAEDELSVAATADAVEDVTVYLRALRLFLTGSAAGSAYRALVAAAQQDADVARLLAGRDPLEASARRVLQRLEGGSAGAPADVAGLVGPVFYRVMTGGEPPSDEELAQHAAACEARARGAQPSAR